jgi:hypothetical protein
MPHCLGTPVFTASNTARPIFQDIRTVLPDYMTPLTTEWRFSEEKFILLWSPAFNQSHSANTLKAGYPVNRRGLSTFRRKRRYSS